MPPTLTLVGGDVQEAVSGRSAPGSGRAVDRSGCGYLREQVTPQVWTLLERFDRGFAAMMDQLHLAWTTPSPELLDAAVGRMFGLKRPSVDLMKMPIPGTSGTYAPCFRLG
jgi:hypothetical protein